MTVDIRALSWSDMRDRPPSAASFGELAFGAAWAIPIVFVTGLISVVLVSALGVTPDSPAADRSRSGRPGAEPDRRCRPCADRRGAVLPRVRNDGLGQGAQCDRGIVRGGLFFAFIHVLQIQAASVTEGARARLRSRSPFAFPIGLMLGWLFIRRDTIWAPIGLHAAFNAILLILAETVSQAPVP